MVGIRRALDLNRCTAKQLTHLSGISVHSARKLIKFRKRQKKNAKKMEAAKQSLLKRKHKPKPGLTSKDQAAVVSSPEEAGHCQASTIKDLDSDSTLSKPNKLKTIKNPSGTIENEIAQFGEIEGHKETRSVGMGSGTILLEEIPVKEWPADVAETRRTKAFQTHFPGCKSQTEPICGPHRRFKAYIQYSVQECSPNHFRSPLTALPETKSNNSELLEPKSTLSNAPAILPQTTAEDSLAQEPEHLFQPSSPESKDKQGSVTCLAYELSSDYFPETSQHLKRDKQLDDKGRQKGNRKHCKTCGARKKYWVKKEKAQGTYHASHPSSSERAKLQTFQKNHNLLRRMAEHKRGMKRRGSPEIDVERKHTVEEVEEDSGHCVIL